MLSVSAWPMKQHGRPFRSFRAAHDVSLMDLEACTADMYGIPAVTVQFGTYADWPTTPPRLGMTLGHFLARSWHSSRGQIRAVSRLDPR